MTNYSKEVRYNVPIKARKYSRDRTIAIYPNETKDQAVKRVYGKENEDWKCIFEPHRPFKRGCIFIKFNMEKHSKNIKLCFKCKPYPNTIIKKLLQKLPTRI